MKRLVCILAAFLLMLGCISFAIGEEDMRAVLNPEGYDLLLIWDIFTNTDSEPTATDAAAPVKGTLTVQGSFGTIDMSKGEWDMEEIGFDGANNARALSLAPDCEIWMPSDLMNPVENVKIDDLQAWFDAAVEQQGLDPVTKEPLEAYYPFDFYATFAMNEAGELTRLEYCYMP